MLHFTIRFIGFSGLIAGLAFLLPVLFPNVALIAGDFWLAFIFIALITWLAYLIAFLGMKNSEQGGVMIIMVAFMVKLLAAAVFVLIYSRKEVSVSLQFIFNFFILYLLFSVFEILGLLRNLRHQNLK